MSVLEVAPQRLALLQHSQHIAIVGMSDNPARASHFVATYLLGATDYDVSFVNPRLADRAGEVLGRPVYPSLDALDSPADIVDVFRRQADLASLTDEAIGAGARAVWFQLGLRDDDAAAKASDAGLDVVQDRCLKIEHARFRGGLHIVGFDTGVIDSRRARLI
jgi:predicted CoA-binding protein